MTTLEDAVVTHFTTHWNTATGDNPAPTFDHRLDVADPDNLDTDSVLVDSRTLLSRARTGIGILKEEWVVTLQVSAKTTTGSTSTLKDRLDQIVAEVLHVMDRTNHALTGYHDHYARQVPYLSIPQHHLAYATVEVYLKKEASTA